MATRPASAMLLAMLVSMLLATSAIVLLSETRAARAAASESYRLIRARHSAAHLTALAIVQLDSGAAARAQGLMFETADGGRVSRQDAAGLLDVNTAAPEQLAALFRALGTADEEAVTLSERIADWRDEDELRHPNGGERAEYEQAGLPPPENRAFETEGQIALVLGMPVPLLNCALPYLTTYSGQTHVDVAAAPPLVLAALGLASTGGVESAAAPGRVIAIHAEAPLSAHAVLRRTLWLRLTGDMNQPVLVHRAAEELRPRAVSPESCARQAT